ncbi:MAG TPA: DegT/DnrJ/EryC1/StrS family aminotransferase [Henriciella marina]|uniref:DegT/DnrJ/EryC1/StrS family aminotransferase n=1 Tax=Henriciella sp. TaxID=1968823 RepID=UPI0017DB80B2|nr:DegT/DnrJ/EryC1/StrS family aminotransferase [Henriciella sp.]HIG22991.1 DegT/DnrJ/EryC1/StrS family aminotransferase [Henriciella sp.]HIK63866.1 DegT/DnrJ/EryC1/StrS family aminotransferase [Henriciella marina]
MAAAEKLTPTGDAPIQFFDLKAQQASIRGALEERWTTILDHGRYIGGPEVDECEQKLCEFTGAADAVVVGSGTQALVMPLIALGYGHGDAVFIPGFTYNATANAVLLAGATPVLVDIDPKTFNIDAEDLERKIQRVKANRNLRARAVMPVDLYGLPADYPAIQAVADTHNLRMVADAAQAFGGRQDGKWIGTLAEITATSFYPTKTLGGYGDGGAILVRDKEVGDILRSIRWHGTGDNRKESIRVGINGRCDSIQCAVVSEKLGIFENERQRRIASAKIYDERLAGKVEGQIGAASDESAYGLYTVRVPERDAIRAALQEKGVPTAIYYDTPIHQMPAFEQFAPPGGLPECERASKEVLSLPMHPYLSEDQIHRVCDALLGALQR